jgi:hypothetical protein
MADIGETGLPLGVDPIGLAGAEERLSAASVKDVKLRLRRDRRFPGEIGAFLGAEKLALSSAEAIIRKALSSPQPAVIIREGMETLRDVDYSYVHFPDFPSGDFPSDKSFLARALVSVGYYAERINRILR